MTLFEEEKAFTHGDQIWASGSIFHLKDSRGEASPSGHSFVRFILPPWLKFTYGPFANPDVCKTNYTVPETLPGECNSSTVLNQFPAGGSIQSISNPTHINPFTTEKSTYTNNCAVRINPRDSAVELHFEAGILFQDFIGVYMSFSVDPDKKIRVGSGIVKSRVTSAIYWGPRETDGSGEPRSVLIGQHTGFLVHSKDTTSKRS